MRQGPSLRHLYNVLAQHFNAPLRKALVDRLRELRSRAGIASQEALAHRAGVPKGWRLSPASHSGFALAGILAWVESSKLALSLVSEVLFFAAMALVPAVIALYHSLVSTDRPKAATGCGIMAVVIPVITMLLIVHGRLVYPVYGIRVSSPAVAENVVAVFYGGMHAVSELLGFATLILSLAMMRGGYGKPIAYLGLTTGVLDFIGAYPYAIGPMLTLVCQVFFAAWFVAVGWKLYRML